VASVDGSFPILLRGSVRELSLAAKILEPYHICGLQSGLGDFKTETYRPLPHLSVALRSELNTPVPESCFACTCTCMRIFKVKGGGRSQVVACRFSKSRVGEGRSKMVVG
jgi:hypothetical protein